MARHGAFTAVLRPLVRAVVPARWLREAHRLRNMGWAGLWGWATARPVPLRTQAEALAQGTAGPALPAFPAADVHCATPRMEPAALAADLPPLPAVAPRFPAVVVHRLQSAVVTGRSNLVAVGDVVLQHDQADYVHDFTSEELHGRVLIDPARRTVRWLSVRAPVRRIVHAAAFTDAVSANYAHWLTEVLPRMHAYAVARPDSVATALLDAGLHANLKASADLVLPAGMPRVELAPGERVVADSLDLVSVAGYIPFGRRTAGGSGHAHGSFSAPALTSMRDHLLARAGGPAQPGPRRVLLRRSSTGRSLVNEQALEAALQPHGFVGIYPERLSFVEQVRLFSGAEMVVGATGAAMANCIFCPPDARILICISAHPEHAYRYWLAMAAAVGNRVDYVLGRVSGRAAQGLHADFSVEPRCVLEMLGLPAARQSHLI